MQVTPTDLPGVLHLQPVVYGDARGFFLETWSAPRYAAAGLPERFAQDNLSSSQRGVLRGLHLQHPMDQGKLVHVVLGEVFDVAADVRLGSPTFGRWTGAVLTAERHNQLWIPPGFAHGFVVLSEQAVFGYKCTEVYAPAHELSVRWDDPDLGIAWPVAAPSLSAKDAAAPLLRDVPPDRLPRYEGPP